MTDLELKEKLTRKMKNNDLCHQRIFSSTPLLWKEYGVYMENSRTCDFSEVFLELIKDWNIQRNMDIFERYDETKVKKAIKEIFKLYEYVSDIYFGFFINNELNVSKFKRLLKIDLTNFKEISEICHIYSKNDNLSKLITRMNTLKKKTLKVLNGIISFSSFVNDEIVPQKKFLDVFVERLKLFDEDQFCIFLLCYDIKKTNHNIF